MSSEHGLKKPAGIDLIPHSRFHHGRFGRLFRNLDPAEHSDDALRGLAEKMVDPNEPPPAPGGWGGQEPNTEQGDNPEIPAGYTYLGQFIDHDITFDPSSSLLRSNDPNALHNFRTPRFDLDSLYGEGPNDEPFLYEKPPAGELPSGRLLIDRRDAVEHDLPRNGQGVALTGDPRNDENVIVSQLQVVFLRAHNKLVDNGLGFEEARRQLRWHYQYVVINDFLPKIVSVELISAILAEGLLEDPPLRFFKWSDLPYMPVEFSVAAYRFGHSMIRPRYDLNGDILDKPIFEKDSNPEEGKDLRGFRPLIPQWGADWTKFFKTGEPHPQPSRLIDVHLAGGLSKLPDVPDPNLHSLAVRNLLRGKALGLPWGEAVAKRIGETPLSTEEIDLAGLGVDEQWRAGFEGRTPLWFYVLREAEKRSSGLRLGPVGGRVVAETLLGLLAADPFSYPNIEPGWTPAGQGAMPQGSENFEMADLIRFATS
jgi:hypothetical protein